MKKIIIVSMIVLLLVVPIAFAGCKWYEWLNPFKWKKCSNPDSELIKSEPFEICENITIQDKIKTRIYKDTIYNDVYCDNKVESCAGQNPNGSYYKSKTVTTFSHYETEYINNTVCKPTGKVNVNGETVGYKDFYCKLQGKYVVCYSCLDGRCQYGEGLCRSGETCIEIDTEENITQISNSLKKEIKKK